MKLNLYIISILTTIIIAGCTATEDVSDLADEEWVYSFTAVLGVPQSRVSYAETNDGNLKLSWDDRDIIRLYPADSIKVENEPDYYEFVAHTNTSTGKTYFVHDGYIPNGEKWSGKAVYQYPETDKYCPTHEFTDECFKNKTLTQTSNGSTDHLKYAEYELDEDGETKHYLEYWATLTDFNLKDNYELRFYHPHTVIYKIMLRGFIYDIPGGSELRMSGDAWPNGEVTTLTLGSKDDKEPFLKVGEFGRPGYDENAVLTAYIIRQVAGNTDGSIKKGETLKFELFSYDKEDGTEYPLVAEDKQTHRTSKVDANRYGYFKNLPWGDEYTWEVTATTDISYNVGDYVVADLSSLSKSEYYPRIAIDLGLPRKWAAYNVGAIKVDDYGKLFAYGYTKPHNLYHEGVDTSDFIMTLIESWTPGDETYDAATANWGGEWITPTEKEMFDIFYYCRMIDSSGNKMPLAEGTEAQTQYQWKDHKQISATYLWLSTEDCYLNYNDVLLARFISTHNGRYFYWPMSGSIQSNNSGNDPGTRGYYLTNSWYQNRGPFLFFIHYIDPYVLGYNPIIDSYKKAYSVRPVKRHLTD